MTSRAMRVIAALFVFSATPAWATFHFMQIEQVIGGVNGDTTAQAIQLRMLGIGQNLLAGSARICVFDAAGGSPVVITTFPAPNPLSGGCRRILIASANFASMTTPPANPEYTMTSLIPPSYLAAGSMTFEDTVGTVYWRISWGGAGYAGLTTGSITNDDNGDFGKVSGALPFSTTQALNYTPACPPGTSTTNAAQYSVTAGNAVFINNDTSSNSFTVTGPAAPTGACCNTAAGTCTDTVTQVNCTGANLVWTVGTLCANLNPPCGGACCDTLTGNCTNNLSLANCSGSDNEWHQGLACAAIKCNRSIPAVSEWGLLAMALLVLTGGTAILRLPRFRTAR